jgi:hypothetical protein
MPRLLRGMARTAVVAGTASAVSGRVQRRQAERFAERDQQIMASRAQGWNEGAVQVAPAPAPAPAAAPDRSEVIEQLKEMAGLRDQGILTEEEFAREKARLLG